MAGFDTLKRLFDPRYYGGSLRPLAPFFEGDNRIRCYFRPDCAEWKREQEDYLEDIKEGKREDEGCSREWATKVELIVRIRVRIERSSELTLGRNTG